MNGMTGKGRGLLVWTAAAWAALAAAWPAPAAAQEAWWNADWPYRRAVTVKDVPRTGLPGEEVGAVTMPTGGFVRPDGRDIRVTTDSGELVDHRVLMVGPGDVVRVAFALCAPATRYFVYLGNAGADAPQRTLDIRRGVLLETWEFRGGSVADLPRVERAFRNAGALLGRDFVDEVYLGHNPFGPQNRICRLFTGHLVCPADGEYLFSTSSQDASFLLIDGKEVVSNGGFHGPQRRAVKQGAAQLSKGLHELKLYHVNSQRDPVAMAAWQEPGGKRLWTIPSSAFSPIRRAAPEMLVRYGQRSQLDFLPEHAGETFVANRYYQRYVFTASESGSGGAAVRYRWQFGDGLTGSGARCEHVYLGDGPYRVTVAATVGGQELSRTNVIHVSRQWDRVTDSRLDPVAEHARIVGGYDFSQAGVKEIAEAIVLLERARQWKDLLRAGDALLLRDSAPADSLGQAMRAYGERLTQRDPARAEAALLKAAEMTRDPAVCAELIVAAGRAALVAGDPARAQTIFERAVKDYSALTTHESIRGGRIGIGDTWRVRGDCAKALEAYRSAGPLSADGYEKQAVRKGDLARHAEDYIRSRQYNDARDSLDTWELEFPEDRLEGFSTLLRVRLAAAQKQHAKAAEEAMLLVRVNPQSNHAAELLLTAARAYKTLGQGEAARGALRRIVQDYPESPLVSDARKMLESP